MAGIAKYYQHKQRSLHIARPYSMRQVAHFLARERKLCVRGHNLHVPAHHRHVYERRRHIHDGRLHVNERRLHEPRTAAAVPDPPRTSPSEIAEPG